MRFINSLIEGLKVALRALGINKVRSILTAICIIIGVTMVTLVDAVTTGMDIKFNESMAMMGQNVVYVEKWPWGIGGGEYKWWEYRNRREMELEYAESIEDYSRLAESVSTLAGRGTTLRYKDKSANGVSTIGASSNYLDFQGLSLIDGRMFTEEENRTGSNVLVIGKTIQEVLFENEYPLGKVIRIGGQKFTVIGVLEEQGSFLGLQDVDNQVLMPIGAYGQIYGLRWGIQIGVKFPTEEALLEGEYEVEGIMRRVRQLEATEENDFAINKPEAFKEVLEGIKGGIYLVGFSLTFLSLLIGGIGVMNIMFVSVRERTKEIGIRKAVGAKSWEILSQFLIEAVVICILGGIIGFIFSAILTLVVNQYFIAVINFGVVLFAFSLCTLIGLVFGFIPAYRAAKSDPIESLRFE